MQPAHQRGILCCHTGGALIAVTAQRLNAANGKQHRTGRITDIGAECDFRSHGETGVHLTCGDHADTVSQFGGHEGVVHERQAFVEWRAHRIGELQRRGTGSPFTTIYRDEIRGNAGGDHGLDDAQELVTLAHTELEADGFPTRGIAEALDEVQ